MKRETVGSSLQNAAACPRKKWQDRAWAREKLKNQTRLRR